MGTEFGNSPIPSTPASQVIEYCKVLPGSSFFKCRTIISTWTSRGLPCKIAMWQDVNSTVQQIATPAIEASFQGELHAVSTETSIPFLDSKLGKNQHSHHTPSSAKPWTCHESASDQSALLLSRLFHAKPREWHDANSNQIKSNQPITTVRRTTYLKFGHTRISWGGISADFDAIPRCTIEVGAILMINWSSRNSIWRLTYAWLGPQFLFIVVATWLLLRVSHSGIWMEIH